MPWFSKGLSGKSERNAEYSHSHMRSTVPAEIANSTVPSAVLFVYVIFIIINFILLGTMC